MRATEQQPVIGSATAAASEGIMDVVALTGRMRAGEEAAYREFYDAYYARLLRYLLVVSRGDEETAGEALEAALLRVVRHIKVFPTEEIFWSWLTLLARSAFSDHSRKRRRYLAFLDRFAQHSRIEQLGPDSAEADARLGAALDQIISRMPEDERQLLEWKYFGHRSIRDIALQLQTSEKAVESRLGRIRGKVKAGLLVELKA